MRSAAHQHQHHSRRYQAVRPLARGTQGRRTWLVTPVRSFTPNHVSLDVEYAHYRIQNVAERLCPAEVCLVDWHGNAVYHSYCQRDLNRPGEKWTGGVPVSLTQDASPLSVVSAEVRNQIQDRVLVGHGLQNDLASLGVKHPAHLLRDTVRCPPFQVKGHAQSLKVLASLHLGLDIQRGSSLHSAREDAEAIMKLYRHLVERDPTEAATPDEMLEVYLYLHRLERGEQGKKAPVLNKTANQILPADRSGKLSNKKRRVGRPFVSLQHMQPHGVTHTISTEAAVARRLRLVVTAAKSRKTSSHPTSSYLSIDIEMAHYRNLRKQKSQPAEVCIVDWDGDVVYHSYCKSHSSGRFSGGVPPSLTQNAKMLYTVTSEVQRLIKGKILVGHAVGHDLVRLGVHHPSELLRDTVSLISYSVCGFKLKDLLKAHLGLHIQKGRGRHSAEEDARAAMMLYKYWYENDLL